MPDPTLETLDRVKRIETRLTQLMIAQGIDTKARKPTFVPETTGGLPAHVIVPSIHSSMQEILAAIPETTTHLIEVILGTKVVAMVAKR